MVRPLYGGALWGDPSKIWLFVVCGWGGVGFQEWKWKNPRAVYAWDLGDALLRKAYAKKEEMFCLGAEAGFEPAIFGL